MGDLMEREQVLDSIFEQYDINRRGELSTEALQLIHSDMRVGGISIPQVQASIKYNCVGENCERSELFDVLQEMDRRYYLVQDFRWEFSLLDTRQADTITETQARWFVEMVHSKYFSTLKWERFLRQRAVPQSGVNFAEIEVMLCNIPSREDWLADQEEEKREREEQARQRRDLERKIDEEKERRKRQREEERRRKEEEDMKRKLEEERRNREDEAERRQRQHEKEDAARRKRKLEEEEERGQREAEEREKKGKLQREREESERQQKEEQELAQLDKLAEQRRQEEEERRKQELREAKGYEDELKDAIEKEREAELEAEKQCKRKEASSDDLVKQEAEEAEKRARLRQKEFRNKRIRYNLKVAIKLRDRERLTEAVSDFKKAKLPDDDLDLPKADKILREFQARDGLRKAITGRKIQPLEQAISYVKRNGYEFVLEKELIEANKVLIQLRRLERIRAEILELKQSTVAEIRSYQKPPPVVHIVMTGTFLILGQKEKETKDWKNVQALVGKTGKEGLKRRCLGCDPGDINPEAGHRAKTLLSQFELDEVRDVSAGAATFFVWSWTMIEEAEATQLAKKQEEEEKKKKQEERKRKKLQEAKEREERRLLGEPEPAEEPSTPPPPAPQPTTPRGNKGTGEKKPRDPSVGRGQGRSKQAASGDGKQESGASVSNTKPAPTTPKSRSKSPGRTTATSAAGAVKVDSSGEKQKPSTAEAEVKEQSSSAGAGPEAEQDGNSGVEAGPDVSTGSA